MCSACGVLGGGPDWIDRVDNPDGIGHGDGLTRGAERQRRVDLVNLLLRPRRSQVVDLGTLMVLRGSTGRSEIVDILKHVWTTVERVEGAPVDPLDPRLLAALADQPTP